MNFRVASGNDLNAYQMTFKKGMRVWVSGNETCGIHAGYCNFQTVSTSKGEGFPIDSWLEIATKVEVHGVMHFIIPLHAHSYSHWQKGPLIK